MTMKMRMMSTGLVCHKIDQEEAAHKPALQSRLCKILSLKEVRFSTSPEYGQSADLPIESAIEDAMAARGESRDQYRAEIRSHKSEMRHLQDEIAPRAEAGTRERQLEKRREIASSNRAFADARGASPEAARDEDLMGGDNEFSALKREKEKDQRKKNDREIRREEILRARTAEREERAQAYRQKEQETMSFLQALAKQRFG